MTIFNPLFLVLLSGAFGTTVKPLSETTVHLYSTTLPTLAHNTSVPTHSLNSTLPTQSSNVSASSISNSSSLNSSEVHTSLISKSYSLIVSHKTSEATSIVSQSTTPSPTTNVPSVKIPPKFDDMEEDPQDEFNDIHFEHPTEAESQIEPNTQTQPETLSNTSYFGIGAGIVIIIVAGVYYQKRRRSVRYESVNEYGLEELQMTKSPNSRSPPLPLGKND